MSDCAAAVIGAIVGAFVSAILMYYLYYKVFKWEKERELVEKRLEKLYSPLYSNIEIISAYGVGTYLFDLDAKFERDLNNGSISDELWQEFETKRAPISKTETVAVIKVDDKWRIKNEEKIIVKKEDGKLKIYGGKTMGFKKGSNEKGEPQMKVFLDQLIEQNSHLAGIELQELLYKIHGPGFYKISEEDIDKLVELIRSKYEELRDEYCKSPQDLSAKISKFLKST
jgi:hypothetical protein